MRSILLLLAGLVHYGSGLPQTAHFDERSFGLNIGGLGIGANLDLGTGLDLGAGLSIGGLHLSFNLDSFVDNLLNVGIHGSVPLLGGLSAQAAAALQGGALGYTAGSVGQDALSELKAWLLGDGAHLDMALRLALLSWCNGGDSASLSVDVIAGLSLLLPTCAEITAAAGLYVTIDGIFHSAELEAAAVLTDAARASLSVFLSGAAYLDADIKAALNLCASGGIISSLSEDVTASLKVWLTDASCTLDASLKASILAWLEGKAGGEVTILGDVSSGVLSAVSVGATIISLVEESGTLVESAQKLLVTFLHSSLAVGLEADIISVLESCANGELAVSISAELRIALAIWLSGPSCRLDAELKAVVLFWLSFAITDESCVSVNVDLFSNISALLTGSLGSNLGGTLRGVLSILLEGGSVIHLSLQARAEIIAVLSGATSISFPSDCITIIVEWLTCCHMPGNGPPPPCSTSLVVPSILVSTSYLPTGTTSDIITYSSYIPGGTAPTTLPGAPITRGGPGSSNFPGGDGAPSSTAPSAPDASITPGGPDGPTTPGGGDGAPSSTAPSVPGASITPGGPDGPTTPGGGDGAPSSTAPSAPDASITPGGPDGPTTPGGGDGAPSSTAPSAPGASSSLPSGVVASSTSNSDVPASYPSSTSQIQATAPTSHAASTSLRGPSESAAASSDSPVSATSVSEISPPAVTSPPVTASRSHRPRVVTVTSTITVEVCG